jgi:5-histidylcysteine sulfoxide synthase
MIQIEQMTSQPPVGIRNLNKSELKNYFINAWELYEMLFSAIDNEKTYYTQPDPLRNPLIFYYGHTAAFFINKMKMAGLIKSGLNTHFDEIFAKGVDPNLQEDFNNVDLWPSLEEVHSYRKSVRKIVLDTIEAIDVDSINEESPYWALLMGIEHDRIHFETSSVLIRQLSDHLVTRPEDWNYAPSNVSENENEWISYEGGVVTLGRGNESDIFAWDNEFGERNVSVNSFKVTKNLITNKEFMVFLKEGYNDKRFWSLEGWEWKEQTNTQHPKFWIQENDFWKYRAMFDVLDMPMDWPVEVNAYETLAYCKWVGDDIRLLTEAEFNYAANMNQRVEPIFSGIGNLNFTFGSPSPVGWLNDPESDLNDLYGNVWDWLSDEFNPLEGFEAHPLYEDFSEPYFDSDHLMMLGGSWATTGTGASKFYRLWFRKFFYQHAGFRLAKSK